MAQGYMKRRPPQRFGSSPWADKPQDVGSSGQLDAGGAPAGAAEEDLAHEGIDRARAQDLALGEKDGVEGPQGPQQGDTFGEARRQP